MEWLRPLLAWLVEHTYVVVFVTTVIDALGLPFPGRLTLIAAGAISAGALWAEAAVSLPLLIAVGTLGTMTGDHVWYLVGVFRSERLLRFYCRITLSSGRCAQRTTHYFERFGAATILIGRFVAGVRILAWPLASGQGVRYSRFLAYDALGALLWAGTLVVLGWAFGEYWERAAEHAATAGWILAAASIVALLLMLVAPRLYRRYRHGPAHLPPTGTQPPAPHARAPHPHSRTSR